MSLYKFEIMLSNILYKLLTKKRGFGIHASAIEINRKSSIFLGKSGAGKSTISQLLSPKFRLLADDLIFIRKNQGSFFTYQTPFMERNTMIVKSPYPTLLSDVFFLHKSRSTKFVEITNKEKLF